MTPGTTAQYSLPRIGSLCSGYGGLDLGLITALGGGTVTWHVEYDKHPSAVLEARFPGVPNYGDVTTTDWSQVEPVDWLTAGYPCQPFSHAGKRKGSSDERHLWPAVARAIGVLRPSRVLLENVRGHVSLGLDAVLGDLAELGYDATWGVVRASDAGAPHSRARIFVVAADARSGPLAGSAAAGDGLSVAAQRGVGAPADTGSGGRRQEDPRGRGVVGEGCIQAGRQEGASSHRPDRQTAPDADRGRCGVDQEQHGDAPQNTADRDTRREHADGPAGAVAWGEFEPAVRRWEAIIGRRAPMPTVVGRSGECLNPRFVEWMQGLPAGWVTDILTRNPALTCLGNGVVPQQAALAISVLCNKSAAAA